MPDCHQLQPSETRRHTKLTRSVHIRFDENVDPTNSVQVNLFVLVVSPIAHSGHVSSACVILLIALREDYIFVEASRQPPTLVRLNPRIVIKSTFDVASVFVSVKPDIYSPHQQIRPSNMSPQNILGTSTSLSCATKSSIILRGLSTM